MPFTESLQKQAQEGDPDSQNALGVAYLLADGTARNYDQALTWFQQAYRQGSAEAAAWLGSMYLAGQGVEVDTSKGLALIKEARDDGSAVGLRFTAMATEKGIGQQKNIPAALDLYQVAANYQDAVSCDRIGLAYQTGIYRPLNLEKASALYNKSSQLGYSWAQLHLGELYASDMVFKDAKEGRMKNSQPWLSQAYAMFSSSADAGNRVAAFRAAEALRQGLGVDLDIQSAASRFQQAARQRYGPAQEELAGLYLEHPELGHTKEDAFVLLSRAQANGQQSATKKAQTLLRTMSPAEVQHANERLARTQIR